MSLRENRLVKPNPSPLPPPPQTFSDSPRKRRGRGYTNPSGTISAHNAGTYNRRSESANKRPGIQSKLPGYNSGENPNSSNFTATTHDNSSFTSPDAVPTICNKVPGNGEYQPETDAGKISQQASEKSTNQPSSAMSSIVSVETKHLGKSGNIHINSAAV